MSRLHGLHNLVQHMVVTRNVAHGTNDNDAKCSTNVVQYIALLRQKHQQLIHHEPSHWRIQDGALCKQLLAHCNGAAAEQHTIDTIGTMYTIQTIRTMYTVHTMCVIHLGMLSGQQGQHNALVQFGCAHQLAAVLPHQFNKPAALVVVEVVFGKYACAMCVGLACPWHTSTREYILGAVLY